MGLGYPTTVPTRLEYVRSYVRFRLPQKTAYHHATAATTSGTSTNLVLSGQAAGVPPLIFWHPCESICHILGVKDASLSNDLILADIWRHTNRNLVKEGDGNHSEHHDADGTKKPKDKTEEVATDARDGEASGDSPGYPSSHGRNDWNNQGVTSHAIGYPTDTNAVTKSWDETTAAAASVEGYPNNIISRSGRVVGGMFRITLSGGNSTSGLMRYSTFPGEASILPMTEIKKQMLHQTTKRLELPRGNTVKKYFAAPMNNPTELGERQVFKDDWSWGPNDPFGILCIMFDDVDFGAMDQEPIVELHSVVTVELPLLQDLRNFRTGHGCHDLAEKRKVHAKVGESGEVSPAWDMMSKFGRGAAEDLGKAAGATAKGIAERVFSGGVAGAERVLPAIAAGA
jgi:hypothetical protein